MVVVSSLTLDPRTGFEHLTSIHPGVNVSGYDPQRLPSTVILIFSVIFERFTITLNLCTMLISLRSTFHHSPTPLAVNDFSFEVKALDSLPEHFLCFISRAQTAGQVVAYEDCLADSISNASLTYLVGGPATVVGVTGAHLQAFIYFSIASILASNLAIWEL